MNLSEVGIVALVVITIIEVLKDYYPKISGNLTRLVALVIGAALGYAGQIGILPIADLTVISGAIAGVVAVGGHTLATKVSGV